MTTDYWRQKALISGVINPPDVAIPGRNPDEVTVAQLESLKKEYGSVNAARIAGIINWVGTDKSITGYEWGQGPVWGQALPEVKGTEAQKAVAAYGEKLITPKTPTPEVIPGQDIPVTRDRNTFIRELSQSLVSQGYDLGSAIQMAGEAFDTMYPELAPSKPGAAPAWSTTREAWELGQQWEQQKAQREEQRWAGEMEYNQQLKVAQERLANLRARLDAEVGITPYRVSTEGEYMAGFGPGGMGERFGIPPVKPAYVDLSSIANQMQGVQMPQIDWRQYLYGGY